MPKEQHQNIDLMERDRFRKVGNGWRLTVEIVKNADKFQLAQEMVDFAAEIVKSNKTGSDN